MNRTQLLKEIQEHISEHSRGDLSDIELYQSIRGSVDIFCLTIDEHMKEMTAILKEMGATKAQLLG